MLKKFTKKVRRSVPSSSARIPGTNNQRSDLWTESFNTAQTILDIAKESVKAVPVPGLEAAISGLSAVLNVYGAMRGNEDALKAFSEAAERLNKYIMRPLKESLAKDPEFLDADLEGRLDELAKDLTSLKNRAEAMHSRKTEKKFFGYKEDAGLIQELNRDLDRITLTFTAQGSIGGEMEARKARKAAQMVLLNGLRRAQARHDSSSRMGTNGCFKGTRVGILQAISAWIDDPDSPSIFWLSGMAGIGKSTIAQTVAELEENKHRLGASFFFSRDDVERRDPSLVYPTIAYQLAIFDDTLKQSVVRALEQDPEVAFLMMKRQFEQLIAEPLKSIKKPGGTIVFVLDALDECEPGSGAVEILRRWSVELPRISQVAKIILKVLVTSRPELHIHNQFQSPHLRLLSQPFILHKVEESVVQADIELFLRHRFGELADLHGVTQPWPSETHLMELVERSSNLFIFAATAINFIAGAKSGRLLQARLEMMLASADDSSASVYQKLDACYLHVLRSAERELETTMRDAKENFRLILDSIVLLRNPLPPSALDSLLALAPGDVMTAIQDLGSILVIPDLHDSSTPIRIFHPSFHDFITTPGRNSGDFFLPVADGHARLAQICFSVIRKSLKRHPHFINNPWLLNSEVGGAEQLETALPVHTRYACRFLASHVSLASPSDDNLRECVKVFCENDLLTWLEAMSLLGDVDGAVSSIQAIRAWCRKIHSMTEHTSELLRDAYHVLLRFQSPLRYSAGHLYTTVLSFSPPCPLTRQYASQLHVEYVLQGQPGTWDANLITIEAQKAVAAVACFPDGERIATAEYTGSVMVWSSSTGASIMSMECDLNHQRIIDLVPLAVSHDGTQIASVPSEPNSIYVWDVNTGANIAVFEGWTTESVYPQECCKFVAFLPESNDVVSVSDICTFYRWDSQTRESKYTCDLHDEKPNAVAMAQDGSTLAVLHDNILRIWDIAVDGISLKRKLRAPGPIRQIGHIAFLPSTTKIAWASYSGREISIWDYTSGVLLRRTEVDMRPFSLASDGARLAVTSGSEIQILDTETLALLGRLAGNGTVIGKVAFSQKESTLVSTGTDSTVRIWDCAELSPPSPTSPHRGIRDCILASQDGQKVAVFDSMSDTLFLWDEPQQISRKLNVKIINKPEMSPDGRFIAFSQESDRYTRQCAWSLYETKTLECLDTRLLPQRSPGPAVFSDDGQLLAISSMNKGSTIVMICSLVTRTVISTAELHRSLVCMAFSPDSKRLLCVEELCMEEPGQTFTMLDGPTGKAELSVTVTGLSLPVQSIRFLPDGLSILVGMVYGDAATLEAKTLRIVNRFGAWLKVQIPQTSPSSELAFLRCENGGYLYKCIQGKELPLVWLPPSWRWAFNQRGSEKILTLWRGSRVFFHFENGELGILDLQALLKGKAGAAGGME
ncbi:hypothetical protein FRC04_010636 [Tulasnella sp. 424]|nr:hypothetical protein FRC04_010636 [Tulasnella sp. 424]KAG8972458.1 hypothetical protein FRC05_010051 [Tulasnella sp. 425]